MIMKKTNVKQISRKSAATCGESAATRGDSSANRSLFVPYLQESREKMKYKFAKGDTQKWIPVACCLLVRPEFAALSPQTRYVFMAILLLCGTLGTDEISANTKYLSHALAADERLIAKSLEELIFSNLLTEQNRLEKKKTEKNTTEQTRGETPDAQSVVVCDFSKSSKTENEDRTENREVFNKSDSAAKGSGRLSRFTLEDCLKYAKQSDGVKNPNALANSLYQTGNADAFIMAMLYPADALAAERESFGMPTDFKDEPCSVCFGAKMSDVDGKGYRKCERCKNEQGKSTGFEPKGESK